MTAQGRDVLSAAGVPDSSRSISACRHQPISVNAECSAPHRVLMALQPSYQATAAAVPDLYVVLVALACGKQLHAIRTERDARESLLLARQGQELTTIRGVPDDDRPIGACTCHACSVRTECDCQNPVNVPEAAPELRAG